MAKEEYKKTRVHIDLVGMTNMGTTMPQSKGGHDKSNKSAKFDSGVRDKKAKAAAKAANKKNAGAKDKAPAQPRPPAGPPPKKKP